jgi:hypothetical protein
MKKKKSTGRIETKLVPSPPPSQEYTPPSITQYNPDKYKIIENVLPPDFGKQTRSKDPLWPHYPFPRLRVKTAPAFIPENDINANKVRLKKAMDEFERQPLSLITDGINKGLRMKFYVEDGFDPETNEKGIFLWRTQ